jgi:hypothetical protein
MRLGRLSAAVAALAAIAVHSAAFGGISAFWFPVASGDGSVGATYPPGAIDGSNGDAALLGMQTWDLRIHTDGDWTLAGLRATLPTGSFYNHPLGGSTHPNPSFALLFPAIAYDTYITGPLDIGSAAAPSITGGFPDGLPTMSGSTFSVSWGDTGTAVPGIYEIARLTYPLGVQPAVHAQSYVAQINPNSTTTAPDWRVAENNRWLPNADGSWHDPNNWTLGRTPINSDAVTLDVGGPTVRTITYSQGETIISALTSNEILLLTGGALNVTGTQHTPSRLIATNGLTLAGGTLRTPRAAVVGSPVTVSAAGSRLENCSLLDGLIVENGATVDIGLLQLYGSGVVGNGAALRCHGSYVYGAGTLQFASGSSVQVDGGTTLQIQDMTLRGSGFTIGVRTPGTSGDVRIGSSGRIVADLGGGSVTITASAFSNNSGELGAVVGAALNVDAPFTGGGRVTGAGAVRALRGLDVLGMLTKEQTGTLRVNGSLSIGALYVLNLAGGSVLNDYDGPTPLPTLRAKIISGYNGGSWNGRGINSSTAAADHAFAIGYAEATDLFTSFPATFAGEPIDDTTLILRLVRAGDANLDGVVNLRDFNVLARNFGTGGNLWVDGDFNYDLLVNLEDFNRLAINFGMSVAPGAGPTPQEWAALATRVPEPSIAFLTLLGVALARRCRADATA